MISISKTFNKYRKRIQINLKNHVFVFYYGNKPNLVTFGMTNETEDNYFVPFIDYDNIYYDKIVKDIKHLFEVFKLSALVLIKSSEEKDVNGQIFGNYMVLGFDKLTYQMHGDMLKHTRCDRNYIGNPKFYKYKNWVIRCKAKIRVTDNKVIKNAPVFKELFINKNTNEYECSLAHKLMYEKVFNHKITLPKTIKFDSFKTSDLVSYYTGEK